MHWNSLFLLCVNGVWVAEYQKREQGTGNTEQTWQHLSYDMGSRHHVNFRPHPTLYTWPTNCVPAVLNMNNILKKPKVDQENHKLKPEWTLCCTLLDHANTKLTCLIFLKAVVGNMKPHFSTMDASFIANYLQKSDQCTKQIANMMTSYSCSFFKIFKPQQQKKTKLLHSCRYCGTYLFAD